MFFLKKLKKISLFIVVISLCLSCKNGNFSLHHKTSDELEIYDFGSDVYDVNDDKKLKSWKDSFDKLLEISSDREKLLKISNNLKKVVFDEELSDDIKFYLMREEILHNAQDLLSSSNVAIPLFYHEARVLMKKKLQSLYKDVKSEIFETTYGIKRFEHLNKEELNVFFGPISKSLDLALLDVEVDIYKVSYISDPLITVDNDGNLFSNLGIAWKEIINDKVIWHFRVGKYKDGIEKIDFKNKSDFQNAKLDPVFWQDGKKITADNFIWAWNRSSSPNTGSPYNIFFRYIVGFEDWEKKEKNRIEKNVDEFRKTYSFYNGLKGLTKIDEFSFDVELKSDCPFFSELITNAVFHPFPIHTMTENTGKENEKLVESWWRYSEKEKLNGKYYFCSSGPFKLDKVVYAQNGYITLSRNEKYFNDSKTKVKKIKIYLFNSINLETNFYNGDVDISLSFTYENVKDKSEILFFSHAGVHYMNFNANDISLDLNNNKSEEEKEIDRSKLRKVLGLLINRNDIVSNSFHFGLPANSIVPPGIVEKYVPVPKMDKGKFLCKNEKKIVFSDKPECQVGRLIITVAKDNNNNYISLPWTERICSDFDDFKKSYFHMRNCKNDKLEKAEKISDDNGYISIYKKRDDFSSEYKENEKKVLEKNFKLAKKLAEEVGVHYDEKKKKFTNFPVMQIDIPGYPMPGMKKAVERIIYFYSLFGIYVYINFLETSMFYSLLKSGKFVSTIIAWKCDYRDALSFLEIFCSNNENNNSQLGKSKKNGAYIHDKYNS